MYILKSILWLLDDFSNTEHSFLLLACNFIAKRISQIIQTCVSVSLCQVLVQL